MLLHGVGLELQRSSRAADQAWGRHLLEDWRSLELLADRLDEQSETEPV
jgi:hypothetical protein